MDAIKTLKTALTHATFEDADIKAATDKLVDTLSSELYAAGYDTGSEVEEAIGGVEDAITAFEQEKEAPITATDEDDDEFAGLGEDEEADDKK